MEKELIRETGLRPEEWKYAPWRGVEPLAVEPPPFDAEDCLRRLSRVRFDQGYRFVEWHHADLRWPMSHQEAHFWLREHPRSTIVGLAPVLGKASRVGSVAIDLVRSACHQHPEVAESALEDLETKLAERVRRLLEPTIPGARPGTELPAKLVEAFEALPSSWKRKRLPSWLDPSLLPAVLADGAVLAEDSVRMLLLVIRESSLEITYSLVATVATAASAPCRDALAVKLYQYGAAKAGRAATSGFSWPRHI